MIDTFGRSITYLRVSVTDRCDLRCVYCMGEAMRFLPKAEVLSLEEMDRVCGAFVRLGVRKLRITGGEPLVRGNVMGLFRSLGRHLRTGALDELTLTTNGTLLDRHAEELADCGVQRINVSLDTLDPERFRAITRRGDLSRTLSGLDAAVRAGLRVKINAVALRDVNEDEWSDLVGWCGERGFDLTFIEAMPMGAIAGDRGGQYVPLSLVRARLERNWTLVDLAHSSGGPSRYALCSETGCRVGFITPMSHGFCESCNRMRLTSAGKLYMCLGQGDVADLRSAVRDHESDGALSAAILDAVQRKPKGHDFVIARARPLERHMSATGG
ncbi:MAG: GTP 3',8-cyclase MoaA [Alphaproteobacteria bacterium]|nr:GTP 3',8-cyclase MoaA [Alphaproteobacteria bacterium]